MTATTAELEMHPAEQARLVTEILLTTVGIDVEPAEASWPSQEESVAAAIHFDGAWSGAMVFACTLPLAFQCAARFMSIPLPKAFDEDTRDTLGELANMIAGNFKALLPEGSRLSIPSVQLEGAQHPAIVIAGAAQLCQSVFATPFGYCRLILARTLA